jgi:hypothetical protein
VDGGNQTIALRWFGIAGRRSRAQEEDALVLARVADGDTSALTELYERYARPLFAFLYRLAGDRGTSPRVILLARVTLVFGYDLILALLSSAVPALLNATSLGLASLITTWLGPMAMLSALSLLLSVCWNPEGAMGVALALWSLHALALTGVPVLEGLQGLWTTGAATIVLAPVLTLAAVIIVGKGEPVRRARATHRL